MAIKDHTVRTGQERQTVSSCMRSPVTHLADLSEIFGISGLTQWMLFGFRMALPVSTVSGALWAGEGGASSVAAVLRPLGFGPPCRKTGWGETAPLGDAAIEPPSAGVR